MTQWHCQLDDAPGISAWAEIKTVEGGQFQLHFSISGKNDDQVVVYKADLRTFGTFEAARDYFAKAATSCGLHASQIAFNEVGA